jgi:hypothetical protein
MRKGKYIMRDIPKISRREWVIVGSIRAVVSNVYDGLSANGGNVEVVFLDGHQAVNRDVRWTGTEWEFVNQGDYGGYADRYPRLQPYVGILRSGQNALVRKRKEATTSKRKLKSYRSLRSRGR